MNTLLPLSWLREHLKTDESPDVLAKRMSLVGNSVEHRFPQDAFLGGVVLGRIEKIEAHPDADKLRVCRVNIGGSGLEQIVCGGVNVAEGQWVAVATVGARVRWHGGEPMVMERAKVRGVESAGMICAAEELGFSGVPSGPKDIWDMGSIRRAQEPGTPLAEVLGVAGDEVFDIEVTTNRPDAMAVVGQAREAAAAGLGTFDELFFREPVFPKSKQDGPLVSVESPLCRRYMAARLRVAVGPSPWWMQYRLIASGVRPINNVVDVTNYVRLEYGQPLHAFDASKVEGILCARLAKKEESFAALNGETYALPETALVIADDTGVLALAGIMGGQESGVNDSTKEILLEAAAFDGLSIRKTSRGVNLASDSQALYEKTLPVELPPFALARALALLKEVAGGELLSGITDSMLEKPQAHQLALRPERIGRLMGVELPLATYRETLVALGFGVFEPSKNAWQIDVPFWRADDIEAEVDFTEEIARFYGYDRLPTVLPSGAFSSRQPNPLLTTIECMRDVWAGAGYTELYSNTCIDGEDAARAQCIDEALRLSEPLSSDMAVLRTSLMPGLLRTMVEQEVTDMRQVFEIGPVYIPRANETPEEHYVSVLAHRMNEGGEGLMRAVKGGLDVLARSVHATYILERGGVPAWAHPGRSARVLAGGHEVGVIAEVHPDVLAAFGLKQVVGVLLLDVPAWMAHATSGASYSEPSLFPAVERDLAVVFPEEVEWGFVENAVRGAAPLVRSVELFDVYRGEGIPAGTKSFAMHLTLLASDRTLTGEEADEAMEQIMKAIEQAKGKART